MGPPELLDPTPLFLLGGCCRHGLTFSPHHPVGWLQGEAQGQLMAREGEAQTPPATATPSQGSREAGGDKYTSNGRNRQKKRVLRKAQTFLPLRNTRAGFCICPNLAFSLWKGLFVQCFVFVSPALISPRWQPAPRIPCAGRCAGARPALSHPPMWQVPSSSCLSQRMSVGLQSA